jgi:ribonuclease HII
VLQFERQVWTSGHEQVAGVDEAGRGPLAGPVVAAAVSFDRDYLEREADGELRGLTDSKKLSATRREQFFGLLQEASSAHIAYALEEATAIDQINILQATHRAMQRALEQLRPPADHVLVDGRPVPGLCCPSTAIVQGDARSLSIAAASIVAKVTRDRIMLDLDGQYPAYGFARHKGYGTREHLEALERHGPAPCHRRTFRPVSQMEFSGWSNGELE